MVFEAIATAILAKKAICGVVAVTGFGAWLAQRRSKSSSRASAHQENPAESIVPGLLLLKKEAPATATAPVIAKIPENPKPNSTVRVVVGKVAAVVEDVVETSAALVKLGYSEAINLEKSVPKGVSDPFRYAWRYLILLWVFLLERIAWAVAVVKLIVKRLFSRDSKADFNLPVVARIDNVASARLPKRLSKTPVLIRALP